jgi:RNA polymerase sigma-70 factor (ECF subfamily)
MYSINTYPALRKGQRFFKLHVDCLMAINGNILENSRGYCTLSLKNWNYSPHFYDSFIDMKLKPTAEKSDREMLKSVLEFGDEQAFRLLYRRHTPRLLGFVSRLLGGDNLESEDVVQETWIQACENLRYFQWRSAFSTWLLGIGLNIVRSNLRQGKRRQALVESQRDVGACRKDDGELRIDLERAIQILPDSNRMVLVLHDIEGWTHREIAENLAIPNGTTKSQLFRARRMIREWLWKRNGARE